MLETLTVKQAQQWVVEQKEALARAINRIDTARRQIHEFASSTREYEQAEVALSLSEIQQAFFGACSKTTDLAGFAHRWGVPESVVSQWAQMSKAPNPSVFRLCVQRGEEKRAYAMPFKPHRKEIARDLLRQFSDTLVRHGWTIVSCDPEMSVQPDDVELAEA